MKLKVFLSLFAIVGYALNIGAQWTDYYSLGSCIYSGSIGNKVFAGNQMGLYCYDCTDYSLSKITKTNHLSDIDISAVSVIDNEIYVGYSNGNIDIVDIENYSTKNLPELKNNRNYISKGINNFYEQDNYVYAATQCGIIVIDKNKNEIKSQYKIDLDGGLSINNICVNDGYIYAATNLGVYRAKTNSKILEDKKEWDRITKNPTSSIINIGNNVFAAQGTNGGNDTIVIVNKQPNVTCGIVKSFRSMSVRGNQIALVANNNVIIKNENFDDITTISHYNVDGENKSMAARFANFVDDNTIVVADNNCGLAVADYNGNATIVRYNGPTNNNAYNVVATGEKVVVTGGGVTSSYNNKNVIGTIHTYADGFWTTSATSAGRDFLTVCYDPHNIDSIYVASWGNGIFKVEGSKIGTQYNAKNSPLLDIFNADNYIRINCLAYDDNSNLYMLNHLVTPGIIIKSPNNEWSSLSYDPINAIHSMSTMIFTPNGNGWIASGQTSGFVVFNTNGTIDDDSDDLYRGPSAISNDSRSKGQIQLWDSNGDVIDEFATAIVCDNEGQIWIGTRDGVVTFNDDENIFEIAKPTFNRIKVPRNDGTNNADYLLAGSRIKSIAVDGANRKWIGTESEGVYLVSADGQTTIKTFNTSNSPLPTNEINAIAIDPIHGEVYIATAMGLLSYASDAIKETAKMSNIKIYPNPVNINNINIVKMIGFERNATVVITDINGRLVHQTTSLGGMVQWDCHDVDGNYVSSGTYIVWAANANGSNSAVGKILVIR